MSPKCFGIRDFAILRHSRGELGLVRPSIITSYLPEEEAEEHFGITFGFNYKTSVFTRQITSTSIRGYDPTAIEYSPIEYSQQQQEQWQENKNH